MGGSESHSYERYLTTSLASNASFGLLLLILVLLPLPKAGMMPGVLSAFMLSAMLVLFLSSINISSKIELIPWLLVWFVISAAVLMHVCLIPGLFGLTNLFPASTVLEGLDVYRMSPVDALRSLNVWAFFTSMWIVAWRVSLASKGQLQWLFFIIFIVSLSQAIFGVAHFISGSSSVLGLWEKEYYLKDVTGTFVNRNHFSGMLALCWPIVLSGLLGARPLLLSSVAKSTRWLTALFYSFVLIVALVSSHSRMGTVAGLVGVFFCFLIYKRASGRDSTTMFGRALPIGAVAFVLLFAVWFGVGDILERYTTLEDGDSRIKVWEAMFDLPVSAWLIGIGPGAFEDVFHLVQPDYLRVRFIYAHNDYLEFVLEFGLIASSLILMVFLYWLWRVFPRGNNALRAGAFGSIAAIALHSVVDFNLQIPGSALFFWIAVGLVMNPAMTLTKSDQDQLNESMNAGRVGNQPVRKRMGRREWLAYFKS